MTVPSNHASGDWAGRAGENSVSVIIPCFNQAHYLPQAIESVLVQNYHPLEILVINDGSTDDTAAVAARYGDRIQLINQANQGLSAARNAGLRLAQGALLHFLDSDDYVLPSFYDQLVAVLAARPDAAAAYCGMRLVDAQNQPLGDRPPLPESDDWFHQLLEENPWSPHALLVRAAALAPVGGFDPALRSCEDWGPVAAPGRHRRKVCPGR